MNKPADPLAAESAAEEARTRRALLHLLEDVQHERDHVRDMRHQWIDTVDSILDPIMVHDGEGRIMRANKAYAGLAGFEFPEIIGKLYWECFPRLAGPLPGCVAAQCAAKRSGGEVVELPNREVYTSRVFPLRDDGPGMPRALHLFKNITQERRREEFLQARSAQALAHAEALNAIGSSVALAAGDVPQLARELTEQVSRACNVARVNVRLFNAAETALACVDHFDAATGSHSASMELRQEQFENEFRALKAAPFVAADDPMTDPRTAGYVEAYLKPNRITSMLDVVVEVSGRHLGLLCLEHVDHPHHWEDDEIAFAQHVAEKIAIAIANRDAHEAHRAQERSERYYRKLIEGSSDAFFVVNREGQLLYRSESGKRLTGYDNDEILGRNLLAIVSPESVAEARRALAQALGEPGETSHAELRVVRKDGSILAVDASGKNLLDDPDVNGIVVTARDITERKRSEASLRGALVATVEAIAATVETRDPYTAGHQRRVALLAAAIAGEMGLPADIVEGIRFGGMIHDLGKIQVPAELLSKPSRLSKIEFDLIKVHPQAGYDIIKRIKFPWRVAEIVHQHHERLDGSGYPQGLKGDAIALEARIVAVADVVEAMASHRPYRPGMGIDAALKEIEGKKGSWFEPAAVDACLRLFRENNYGLDQASA